MPLFEIGTNLFLKNVGQVTVMFLLVLALESKEILEEN